MRKLVLTLTAATLALGMTALTASAQTQLPGAARLHAQVQNATPLVEQAACRGFVNVYCPRGWYWACVGQRTHWCQCWRCHLPY